MYEENLEFFPSSKDIIPNMTSSVRGGAQILKLGVESRFCTRHETCLKHNGGAKCCRNSKCMSNSVQTEVSAIFFNFVEF